MSRVSKSWRAASTHQTRSHSFSPVFWSVGWKPVGLLSEQWSLSNRRWLFTRPHAYEPPSSVPCLRVSPPLGTCCFKDGQQSEELLSVVKLRVGSLERHFSASRGLTQTPPHHCSTSEIRKPTCLGIFSYFKCHTFVFNGYFTSLLYTLSVKYIFMFSSMVLWAYINCSL